MPACKKLKERIERDSVTDSVHGQNYFMYEKNTGEGRGACVTLSHLFL